MYCRTCGNEMNDNAEFCVKCGVRRNVGTAYCQACGAKTTEVQEMCVNCGCRLKTNIIRSKGVLEGINIANVNTTNNYNDGEENLDFSLLDPYYQKEFQKIYESGETYKGKFNIWGFLFGSIWALTKGCWLSAIVSIIISFLTAGVGGVIYWFIFGFRGTYMYYCSYVKDTQCIV